MVLYGVVTGAGDRGTTFALGQLILEAALIPIAVFGFWYVAQEFQKGQRRPDLYLSWDDEVLTNNRELSVYIQRPDTGGNKTPARINRSIALHNIGDNIAVWYTINLAFPVELFRGRAVPPGWDQGLMGLSGFYGEFGGKDYWSQRQMPSTQDEVFRSNGNLASYPRQKIILGTLKFVPVPEEDQAVQEYEIRYKIYTDAGPSRIDYLILKVIWED